MRRLYPLSRVPGARELGFWAGVERIPNVRLVDLDDWSPAGEAAGLVRGVRPRVRPLGGRLRPARRGARGRAAGVPPTGEAVREPRRCSRETGAAFERLLRANPVARLVCYSGLIGRSPAFQEAARRAGIEVLTVEGWTWRPGHMICNLERARPSSTTSTAGCGRWAPGTSARENDSARLLRFQEGGARARPSTSPSSTACSGSPATDPVPAPVAAFLERRGPAFLLATNVVGDSSILRRNPIFRNQRDWLRQTIDFFRARPDWSLIVRAHPDEAWVREKVVVRMGEVAREIAGEAPNVLVIAGRRGPEHLRAAAGPVRRPRVGQLDRGRHGGPRDPRPRRRAPQVPRARRRGGAQDDPGLLRGPRPPRRRRGPPDARAAGPRAPVPEPRLLGLLLRRLQPPVPRARPRRSTVRPTPTCSIGSWPETCLPRPPRGARRAAWREDGHAGAQPGTPDGRGRRRSPPRCGPSPRRTRTGAGPARDAGCPRRLERQLELWVLCRGSKVAYLRRAGARIGQRTSLLNEVARVRQRAVARRDRLRRRHRRRGRLHHPRRREPRLSPAESRDPPSSATGSARSAWATTA